MALVIKDRVKETTTTTGTGTYTLAGAVSGFETFTANLSNSDTTYYVCTDNTDFEVGLGTFTSSGTTLARTTILASSNSNNEVNWSSGTRSIFMTYPADKAVFEDASNNINGTFVGNITGNVTGNTSGTAATVTGAAQTNITSLGTLTALTVDNVAINATTIGHTDDTDLITLADGVVTVAGEISVTTLDIGGTNVTSTAAELNVLDGIASIDTDISSVSGSDDTLASAKAIKTYVDAQVTAQDLDFQGDSGGALSIDLDSETLDIAGGTGIDTSGSSNTLTVAIDSTVTTLSGTQTLTNKTLTSPKINEDVALTSTATELNLLDGVSGLVQADFTKLAAIDSTATELNLLDGITGIADEDDMTSDSNTKLATQQSIKAYVDAQKADMQFVLEDGDGTEVQITKDKEVKFVEGGGLDINWTDTSTGSDADPYDLTFTVNAAQTGITSLLATDIKIGEDDQTKIDFETADTINFYAGNEKQLILTDGALTPGTNAIVDLGTDALEFKDAYFDGTVEADAITIGGTALSEVISDTTGAMFSSNTETGITVTYQDADNTIDVAIDAAQTAITSVVNTSLEIGRDADNRIKFGTDNQIIFEVSGGDNVIFKASGEIEATSLDISGDADIDGTLEADAITVNGTALNTVIAGVTVANATLAATTTVANSTANTNFPVVFHDESNGLLDDTGALRYNPSTGELLVPKLTVAGTTTTVDTVTMNAQNAIIFEGATADSNETTLTIIDPTSDHTINLPNLSGTIPLLATVSTTQISSTPEELNILDGATVVVGEINALDLGSTAVGTAIASKAMILDSNKDYTGVRNFTLSGELDAGSLDISGDADIDGTLEADAITVGGTALNTVIAGVTVTNATTAAVATTVTISDNENTNEENAVVFTAGGDVDGGNIGLESDGDLTYNPSTGTVSATVFKGNIDAVDGDFDGTLEADAITVAGTALATVIAGTTVTDATNSAHVLVTDNESTNEENLITFVEGATSSTGNVGLEMDGNLTYNPSTGRLTATQLAGTLQTAAQSNVTSLGTLTTLTVDNVIINGSTIGHTGDTDLMTVASGVLTVAGEVDATSLDISGDADIDGTLEADAITVNGTALNTVIADEATALAIALG